MAKERIGLMGGSFNPIHARHLEMARVALGEMRLDRVVFLSTGNPPHKHAELADGEDRYEMTRLAVAGMQRFFASRMELDREGVIYTVDTLRLLKKQCPEADFFYIIGEDTMLDLPNWRTPDQVFTLCEFIVCCRSTADLTAHPLYGELTARGARMHCLSLPPKDISSTDIRRQLGAGQYPEEIAPQVMEYIRIMGLYGVPPRPAGARLYYPKLRRALSDKRLVHSLLVAWTAGRLAEGHGVEPELAETAGLLHDCAKCMPLSEMQRIAQENQLSLDRETLRSDNLLHGYVGAVVAEKEYGVVDPDVLSAIRCHTTGKVGMQPLDMILYLADKIEPSRRDYPALREVRRLAETSLVKAVGYSMRSTLDYVRSQHHTPHPATQRAADWLNRLE